MTRGEAGAANTPVLSVVVTVVCDTTRRRSDAAYLEATLRALMCQQQPPTTEIVVPYAPGIRGIERLQVRFPNVRFLRCEHLLGYRQDRPGREHHDELRARGLAAARGEFVALIEDHGRPDPHWCANLVNAHRQGYSGVGGAIENGVDRPLNWAVYFCDFGAYQNPVGPGTAAMISDANASYRREALEAIRSVWERKFHQILVNRAIVDQGGRLGLFPDVVVYQHREDLGLGEAVLERFIWGRSFAASRCGWISGGERALRALLAPLLPPILVARLAVTVFRKRRFRTKFLLALPLIVLLEASWSLGELAGYLTGATGVEG